MEKLFLVITLVLWVLSLVGVIMVVMTNFQYEDINILTGIILLFTLGNAIIMIKRNTP